MGISYADFWNMNPRIYKIIAKGFEKKMEQKRDYDNFIAYMNGIYVREALVSTVGNMFLGKGKKPYEYPDKPIELSGKERELTEDEKELQRQNFLASLFTMQSNFERNKKEKGEG